MHIDKTERIDCYGVAPVVQETEEKEFFGPSTLEIVDHNRGCAVDAGRAVLEGQPF